MDETNKSRKVIECGILRIKEARRKAGKTNLVTDELIELKSEKAQNRKAEGQSGEPGFPGMSKFLIPTEVMEPTGKMTTTLRMQEPTTRKRGPD